MGRNLKISVVLNQDSGTLRDGDADAMVRTITDILRSHRHKPEVKLAKGADIAQALTAAMKSHEAVFVGGVTGRFRQPPPSLPGRRPPSVSCRSVR